MIEKGFFEIAVILMIAGGFALVGRFLKQPPILAYILTGVVAGPLGYLALDSRETLEIMSRIGITLLLFLVGVEMNITGLKNVGKAAAIVGLGQVAFTAVIGFFVVQFLGFSTIASIYIAVALTFSSTIIVVKLLSEKKDLHSLYGRLMVGVLLIQDLLALIALVFLAGFGVSGSNPGVFNFLVVFLKGAVLFAAIFFFGKNILPALIKRIAKSQELLFLLSIAWALGVAYLFSSSWVGLSLEIGGFLAGIALSFSAEHFQIHSRIRPLRDFFIIIFFIVLGSTIALGDISGVWPTVAVLSLFVLIGNPLIVMILMGVLGYKKRTSFLSGITMAQISEFSFVLMQLGRGVGHFGENEVSIITLVGIITITGSTYLIIYGDRLYSLLSPFLSIFEKKQPKEKALTEKRWQEHIILAGAHRLGQHLLTVLPKEEVIIVDFNPDVVEKLGSEGFHVVYGDIADEEIQDDVHIFDARIVISTVPDVNDNLFLLNRVKKHFPASAGPKIIMTAMEEWEARLLYEEGADYVILPHFIGGQQVAQFISEDANFERLAFLKKRDLDILAGMN
ncbi:MAG: cation:proton antiporter [Parcubacteria group bacterium]|nr:cation:proton antiporter [Parcubacteria group bacterium]